MAWSVIDLDQLGITGLPDVSECVVVIPSRMPFNIDCRLTSGPAVTILQYAKSLIDTSGNKRGRWSSRRGKTDRRKGKARSRDNHTCITNRKKNEKQFSRITIEHHEPLLYFSSGDN